jgi:hypothetical protein
MSSRQYHKGNQSLRPQYGSKSVLSPSFWLLLSFSILLILLMSACTRSTIPIDATVTRAIVDETSDTPIPSTPEPESYFQASETYAVAWIPRDDNLKLRVPAGISGSIVDELTYDTHGVTITGNTTSLGSSLWVEIEGPDGEMGWVNSWNLTEDVDQELFCADARVLGILEQVSRAFLEEDASQLRGTINPKRGLILRHDWWNPEVILKTDEVENLYLSRADRTWGVLRGGDFAIQGPFKEIFSPSLLDVFSQTPTAVCKEIPGGVTSLPIEWPGEYENIHFYAFHRPSPEGGNRFDWRTFVLGFEYIQGTPYLTLLVQYQGDI